MSIGAFIVEGETALQLTQRRAAASQARSFIAWRCATERGQGAQEAPALAAFARGRIFSDDGSIRNDLLSISAPRPAGHAVEDDRRECIHESFQYDRSGNRTVSATRRPLHLSFRRNGRCPVNWGAEYELFSDVYTLRTGTVPDDQPPGVLE
jgi:hypothetical protein